MDSDDDPVVKEIPVYLSQELATKLYIFQYSNSPGRGNYDDKNVCKASIKPGNKEVRLEVALDVESSNYDHSRGQQIAATANGEINDKEDEDNTFDSHLMNKIVLVSKKVESVLSNFAVGVFQDDELHITPLEGVIELVPEFEYLDKCDKSAREDMKNADDIEEEDEGPKQVNVTFARQKPDFIKKLQEQSSQNHTKKCSEEKWFHTNYIESNTSKAELTRLEMFCPATDESLNTLNLTYSQYGDVLINQEIEGTFLESNKYIQTLPLLDQIRMIMKNAKIVSFQTIKKSLSDQDLPTILKYLQQVAVLVQGNWIINSELLYPKDSKSLHNGIPGEIMCRARDYILLSYTDHEYLDTKNISSITKLQYEEVEDILTELAGERQEKGWKLKLPSDNTFQERYPEIVQRQQLLWEAKRKYLREAMEAQNQAIPQRQRRRSNRESIGSENEERNVGRGRKSLRDSSISDNDSVEPIKQKKSTRSRKTSETT